MFAVIIMGGCPFVFDRNILVFEISFQQNDRLTKFHLLLQKRLLVVDDVCHIPWQCSKNS